MRKIFVDHQQVKGKNYRVILDDFILSKTKKNILFVPGGINFQI